MGILDYILAGLGPEARKKIAKTAAESAVKNVGDAIYEKADALRREVEEAAREKREARERAEAEAARERQKRADAQSVEDELAALKRSIERKQK